MTKREDSWDKRPTHVIVYTFHCLEQSDNKSKNYAVVDSGWQQATLWHAGLISCKKFIAVINFQRGHGASV